MSEKAPGMHPYTGRPMSEKMCPECKKTAVLDVPCPHVALLPWPSVPISSKSDPIPSQAKRAKVLAQVADAIARELLDPGAAYHVMCQWDKALAQVENERDEWQERYRETATVLTRIQMRIEYKSERWYEIENLLASQEPTE